MNQRIREVALIGVFSALAYAGGILFSYIPNIEVITAIIFLSGLILGSKNGMLVGAIAQTLYSTLNPYGPAALPLLIAQVLNRILVGYVGGRFRVLVQNKRAYWTAFYFGLAGLLLTWLYDLMTYLAIAIQSGYSMQEMKVAFVLGILWYLVHGGGNLVIFAIVLPYVAEALQRADFIKRVNLS